MCNTANNVVASLVADHARLNFYPTYLGRRQMMKREVIIFNWMENLCIDYRGGYWNFYILSNGGFYVAPELPGLLHIAVDGNGFEGAMSPDAAGIVVTLFALCQFANGFDEDDSKVMTDRFHLLREFAGQHTEASAIFSAID